MKKAPAILAVGFILITFFRVSVFLSEGMKLGWLGISFAIALTAGVYVSAYFTQFKETKLAAFAALVPFAVADLWFNEMEMIRALSPETLIAAQANFLNFSADSITRGLHISAVVYGALPTVFAALLGWLQADAEKVASLNKKGWIAQLWAANVALWKREIQATAVKTFGNQRFAELKSGNEGNQPLLSVDESVVSVDAGKIRWEDLKVADKEEIAAFNTRQIQSKWQVSPRTARNWKKWVGQGK